MKFNENTEHPIDKLFAQKLGNLEGNPPENAWQKIQEQTAQKSRKKNKAFIWIPYAAASVVVILVSVWLLNQQVPTTIENPSIAQNAPITSKKTTEQQATVKVVPLINKPLEDIQQKSADKQQRLAEEKYTKNEILQPQVNNRENKKANTTAEHKQKVELVKPIIESVENPVAQLEKEPTVITPSAFAKDESTTLVVTVKLEEQPAENTEEVIALEESEEPVQKQSKAGRLLNTLKKIKKADFNELGIRPETIVAYVKDKATANTHSNEK